MNNQSTRLPRTIIRIGKQSLLFVKPGGEGEAVPAVEPFTVKSNMSMAANLRTAFKVSETLSNAGTNRTLIVIDSPVALIPIEEYSEEEVEKIFRHTFPYKSQDVVMTHVVPDLNCVAAFSVNKDLRTVITDHYSDVRIVPVVIPVCRHLHQHSHVGPTRKLYAYFHDRQLTIASFATNRFRFMNTYEASEVADATYFILYVWQQLALSHRKDELYIVGDTTIVAELRAELQRYLANVFSISPAAEFNRAPITRQPHITYDIICLCES